MTTSVWYQITFSKLSNLFQSSPTTKHAWQEGNFHLSFHFPLLLQKENYVDNFIPKVNLRISKSKLSWKILPPKPMHTHLRHSKLKSAAFRLSKRIITFQTLLKQKQHKLWKPHHVTTEVLRSSHCNSTASSVPEWQKNPNTKKKPFKINSTRNADVLNKGSVVMAAKL